MKDASPRLRDAIAEIQETLDNYDLAAIFAVSTEDQMATMSRLSPTWSLVRDSQFEGYHRVHFRGAPEAEQRRTLRMIEGFHEASGRMFRMCSKFLQVMRDAPHASRQNERLGRSTIIAMWPGEPIDKKL